MASWTPNKKPRDSTAPTLSTRPKSNAARRLIATVIAFGEANSGVMSLNTMPGFGKSGTSRRNFARSMWLSCRGSRESARGLHALSLLRRAGCNRRRSAAAFALGAGQHAGSWDVAHVGLIRADRARRLTALDGLSRLPRAGRV